jgi:hypothetical protein
VDKANVPLVVAVPIEEEQERNNIVYFSFYFILIIVMNMDMSGNKIRIIYRIF